MCKCGNCNNCNEMIAVDSVTVAAGTTTINIPATFTPEPNKKYCFLVRTSVANDVTYNAVVISNGTATWPIETCSGNNWRPCLVKGRSIIRAVYLSDPAHFLLRSVKHS